MSAYLGGFEYDIFLSHAWSGNPTDHSGDRAWATDLQVRLERELRERLSNDSVSIFLDSTHATNGNIDREFNAALLQSALFLAVVTPAFCEPTCFCRKEVDWFSKSARPISSHPVDTAKRLFKVVSRPVRREDEPEAIRENLRYVFYEPGPGSNLLQYDRLPINAVDGALGSQLRRSYVDLVNQLVGYLSECKQIQPSFPVRRIFLAETTCTKKGALIAELRPHETVQLAHQEGMSESDFEDRTREVLTSCDRSVHLVDTTAKLTAPDGWHRSKLEIQLSCALESTKSNFRVVVWCDPESPIADPELAAFIGRLDSHFPNSDSLVYIPKNFEYLAYNVREECTRAISNAEPPSLPIGQSLYLQCFFEDFKRLEPLVKALYKEQTAVRFPYFQGKKKDLERLNKRFVSETDITLFYWGTSDDSAMFMECDRTAKAEEARGKLRLIGLDPDEFRRRGQAHPQFTTIPFPAHDPKEALAALRAAISRARR